MSQAQANRRGKLMFRRKIYGKPCDVCGDIVDLNHIVHEHTPIIHVKENGQQERLIHTNVWLCRPFYEEMEQLYAPPPPAPTHKAIVKIGIKNESVPDTIKPRRTKKQKKWTTLLRSIFRKWW